MYVILVQSATQSMACLFTSRTRVAHRHDDVYFCCCRVVVAVAVVVVTSAAHKQKTSQAQNEVFG